MLEDGRFQPFLQLGWSLHPLGRRPNQVVFLREGRGQHVCYPWSGCQEPWRGIRALRPHTRRVLKQPLFFVFFSKGRAEFWWATTIVNRLKYIFAYSKKIIMFWKHFSWRVLIKFLYSLFIHSKPTELHLPSTQRPCLISPRPTPSHLPPPPAWLLSSPGPT